MSIDKEIRVECKINKYFTSYFSTKSKNMILDDRIAFVSKKFLINNKIVNNSWVLLKNDQNESTVCMIWSSESILSDENIFINPIIFNFLCQNNNHLKLNLNSNWKIPNYVRSDSLSLEKLLPSLYQVKKLKLMKLFISKETSKENEFISDYFSDKIRIISLDQLIPMNYNTEFIYDCVSQCYSNDISYFKVVEIQYEEIDILRKFIKDENIVKLNKISKNTPSIINGFICFKNIIVEIVENSANDSILPLNYLKLLSNEKPNKKSVFEVEQFDKSYSKLKKLVRIMEANKISEKTIFFTGSQRCFKKLMLKKLADSFGFSYLSKDLREFTKIEKFISWLKKYLPLSRLIINIKRFELVNSLFKNSDHLLKEFLEILKIFSLNKVILVFNTGNINDLEMKYKVISNSYVDVSLPNLQSRIEIMKVVLHNIFENYEHVFNLKIGEKIKKLISKINEKFVLQQKFSSFLVLDQTEYEEIGKLTVGKDCGDLKQILLLSVEKYIQKIKILLKNKDQNEISQFYFKSNYISESIKSLKNTKILNQKATATSIPEIKWSDVGGLENAKDDINDTIQLPLKYPKLFENGLKRRSGLLLYGPPGTGKTLLAKAIANECSMNFISVKGPELLNMYVGESEKNIREVFEKGRENRPCVLFFDEIDALVPSRSKNSDSNNVMDRIVAQFMSEMDGLTKENDLIIIASTNRPDLLDVSLLRPGRFDKMIYIGLPRTIEEKVKILKAQTKNLLLSDDVDFEQLAGKCHPNFSGADIYSICASAFTLALKNHLNSNNPNDKICVSQNHFINSIERISPSLSDSEIQKYEELKLKYNSQRK